MQKIKLMIITLVVALSAISVVGLSTVAASPATDEACNGLQQVDPGKTCDAAAGNGLNSIIRAVVTILSYIVGVAAVIMVIIAGLKYITANGDSNSIGSAKNTLVYALLGLAIAVLAQVLVHFVLGTANNAANGKPTGAVVRQLEAA